MDHVEDEFYYLASQGTGYWVKLFSDELKEGYVYGKIFINNQILSVNKS
ncbi:MAG: hypothetical protein RXR43_15140 [Sulfolobus sp.]